IEGQFLRVTQAGGENFQFRAVGIAAEDGTGVGAGNDATPGQNVEPPVADAEVQFAIRPEAQAVQVGPVNTDMDPVTPVQHLADIGLALALRIAEEPEVGNAGVPDLAAARQNARPDAVGDAVETVGKNAAADDLAVPVRVFKQTDAVVLEG